MLRENLWFSRYKANTVIAIVYTATTAARKPPVEIEARVNL